MSETNFLGKELTKLSLFRQLHMTKYPWIMISKTCSA